MTRHAPPDEPQAMTVNTLDRDHEAATETDAAFECVCSAAQERFWILEKLSPGNAVLNVAVRWRVEGRLVAELAEQAFQAMIRRHETLRTAIIEAPNGLIQRVLPDVPFRLAVVDLLALPEGERERMALSLGAREAATPFVLDEPPLLRATLLRLSETRSILLVTAHHIVCDGWSIGILARDFGETYAALRAGRAAAALPELPIQYADYTLWRAETDDPVAAARGLDYWARQLAGMRHFEVPPDHPRPPIQTANGAIMSQMLPRDLARAAFELGRGHGATPFMTALAALLTVLHRYTGETEIGIGTQIAGRDQLELVDLVGLFINTVVLRADLHGDPSFAELLARTTAMVADALAHQSVPIEKVIEALKPPRDLSRNALFSVNFIFQRSFVANAAYGDIALIDLPSQSAGALYDLNFFMVERPEGWRVSCEYNTDLFLPETVTSLLQGYVTLLGAIPMMPHAPLAALPVIDADASHLLLKGWNDTRRNYPRVTVLDLFAEQAERTPDADAIVSGKGAITYRALQRRAAGVAALLSRRVAPGGLIGLCCDRSPDMVVALLGILGAGCAYVPLDPAYPAARLRHAVEDSGLALVLTEPAHAALFDAMSVAILVLPGSADEVAAPPLPGTGDIAYVIYTSGSTGRPKGVEIRHSSLANLLLSMRERPGLSAADTLVAVTSLSFDIAALELFLPLICGARLVIANPAQASDGAALKALLSARGVTVMQATPSTWQMLLEAGWKPGPHLKMLCGGEALPRRLADRLLAGGGTLWNMYGPTETTIWSAAAQVTPGAAPVPIGPPIANTQFHVLDAHGALAMPGARGELYVGGAGLALGYRNNVALTAERFVRHPLAAPPESRLYRTGDIVRRRFDGSIEFLGRTDHQVKLRGFRIELGDVEAAITGLPGVRDCVAQVRPDPVGEPHLVAWLVPDSTTGMAGDALIATVTKRLAGVLPGYMVPSAMVTIDALPLTPNGKIDRGALVTPERRPVPAAPGLTAATAAEQHLAAIWREVLGVDEVGLDDNFFDLGGHSLLAARMLSRLAGEFGRPVSLTGLFQAPTLRELARLVPPPEPRAGDPQVVMVQPNGARPPIFAINNTSIFHHLSRNLGPDQPFIAVQAFDADLDEAADRRSFEEIAAGYARTIRSLRPHGPYTLLGLCVAGKLAYEVARQLRAEGKRTPLLVLVDAWAPAYSKSLPPLRRWLAEASYAAQRQRYHLTQLRERTLRENLAFYLERPVVLRARAWLARLGRRLGHTGMPGVVEKDLRFVKLLEAAAQRYVPPAFDGRVLLFYRTDQPQGRFLDPHLGWGRLARGGVQSVGVPGDHLGMFREPGAGIMAAHIKAALDQND